MVPRPGGGHIEQPDELLLGQLLLDDAQGVVARRLEGVGLATDPNLHGARRAVDDHRTAFGPAPVRVQADQDDDGELQALGGVHGHNPHRVLISLGHRDFRYPGPLGYLPVGPGQEGPQWSPACLDEGAGLVHQELVPAPHFPRARTAHCGFDKPPSPDEPLDQHGRRRPEPPFVVFPNRTHPLGHRTLRRTLGVQVIEAALPPNEVQQVLVGAGEGRAPQGGHQRYLVRGVVDGPEAVEQVPYLLGLEYQRRTLEAVGHAPIFQGQLQGSDSRPRGHQDTDVRVAGRAVTLFIGLIGRLSVEDLPTGCRHAGQHMNDGRGLLLAHRSDGHIVGGRSNMPRPRGVGMVDCRLPSRHQRHVLCLPRGCVHPSAEQMVHPGDDGPLSTEILHQA